MSVSKDVFLVGYASGVAARQPGAAHGPICLQGSNSMAALQKRHLALHWRPMIRDFQESASKTVRVSHLCQALAVEVKHLVTKQRFFVVLGGDHSCAIGTWNGVSSGLREEGGAGSLGLIWIDAHMDSHTPETTPSGNIHGMPLAILLGHGEPELTHLSGFSPVLKPEHVCLIGVRSFEPLEAALLDKLGVRIFFMQEVRERGFSEVIKEARKIVAAGTEKYGISLDIDSIDPVEAPGTGACEPDGISVKALLSGLGEIAGDSMLAGFEIAEFDPGLDVENKTEKLIPELMAALTVGCR